jgi:cyanophycin synthetase
MRVLDRSVYRGPHVYGGAPMIRFALDLGELEQLPTDRLPGFAERLLRLLPGLARHGCSRGHVGGFVERLHEGTWIGHVVEHVALQLQVDAGDDVTRGKTRAVAGRAGVYDVLYAYRSEAAGLLAGRMALELVAGLLPAEYALVEGLDRLAAGPATAPGESVPGLAELRRVVAVASLGPTTRSLADEARRRGIPVARVDDRSLVRFGWGSRQRLIRASVTDATSHLGVLTAGDKGATKRLLASAGIPVPRGMIVTDANAAVAFAADALGAVVTKPLAGNHGRGVSTGLRGDCAVREGFVSAAAHGPSVIVEEHLPGRDHRILVVGGRVVAVAERVPARVVGDGTRTVRELIDELNADPRRGAGHEAVMTRVHDDAALASVLAEQALALDDIPQPGLIVLLRATANLSTGGEAIDRTDDIHPAVAAVATRAAAIIGLDVAGIDLVTSDIGRPLNETGGGIVEINAAPGFRMHLAPSRGVPRDVAAPVIDLLFPPGSRSRIPVVSVTGTNGKSTTVRMIAHILGDAGAGIVGMTTTSGVYVDRELVRPGDSSGPRSARVVLADPTVDVAVLETARGGLLREGLAYDRADVGVVLNVAADHLGLKGVETLADLARVKSVIARRVRRRGATVLNADDPLTRRMARRAGGRVAFFTAAAFDSIDEDLRRHVTGGGVLATLETSDGGGVITLHDAASSVAVIDASGIPATWDGGATFNISNAQAATLAAHALGIPAPAIAAALAGFSGTFEQNPGRVNVTRVTGFTTIVDYAHNPAALRALGDLITRLRPGHRRVIGVVSTPGDRRDEDILELGRLSAVIFDEVVFRELPDGRGRPSGGVVGLLSDAAEAAGMPADRMRRVMDETEAMDAALRLAGPEDLVVLTVSSVDAVWAQVNAFTPEWVSSSV